MRTLCCVMIAHVMLFAATRELLAEHSHVYVPGQGTMIADRLKGRLLSESLGCASCHSTTSQRKHTATAPRLRDVAERLNPYYIEQFIQAPHITKPGTTMPNVMAGLSETERNKAATAITQYLLAFGKSKPFRPQGIDAIAAEYGDELFHSVGCVACHSPRDADGSDLLPDRSVPLVNLAEKYHVD
ncbi:MAG: hypothetical protein AAF497_29360, partial [Planctomycetota bacterium]